MFHSFEKSCPPREVQPLDWNLFLVLRCLSQTPFEPLKLASDKHRTWKTSFLLALTSAKRVSELHSLSFRVCHSWGWGSCTFFLPAFVAKIHNPLVLTLASMSSQSSPWMTLWTVTEMNSCSAPSELFGSTFPRWSSIVLISRVSSSPLYEEEKGVLQHHFFLAAVSHLLCVFVSLRGGLLCSTGQATQSLEGRYFIVV